MPDMLKSMSKAIRAMAIKSFQFVNVPMLIQMFIKKEGIKN